MAATTPDRRDRTARLHWAGRFTRGPRAGRAGGFEGADGVEVEVVESEASEHVRSPVDVLRLVTAATAIAVVVVVDWLLGDTLTAFTADLFAGLAAVPAWLVSAVVTGARALSLLLLGAGTVAVVRTGRWRPVLPVAVAALAAAGLAVVLDPAAGHAAESLHPALPGAGALAPGFPSAAGLAAASAAATAAAPWLDRRWRHACWAAVLGLAVARFLATPASFDTLAALLLGWLVGAAAVVVLGGPWRRPRGRAVAASLAAVGVPLARLEQASVDARGSTPYFGEDTGGRRLFVKVLGDDERSADRLFRLYRRLTPRDLGDERPFTTLRRAVEHEALVALAARDLDVRTPRLVALARAEPNGFVLVYEAIDGRSFDRVSPAEVTDDLLAGVWAQVAGLRRHRIAHRDLRLANVFLDADDRAWLIDFGFSELAASDLLLANDVAELVASSSLLVGADRAVAVATEAVGWTTLVAARDRLRPWALSGATRRALHDRPGLLDDIHHHIARL
jgi:undecaprenyl-diphosphatase